MNHKSVCKNGVNLIKLICVDFSRLSWVLGGRDLFVYVLRCDISLHESRNRRNGNASIYSFQGFVVSTSTLKYCLYLNRAQKLENYFYNVKIKTTIWAIPILHISSEFP